jgi:hypothetical protein
MHILVEGYAKSGMTPRHYCEKHNTPKFAEAISLAGEPPAPRSSKLPICRGGADASACVCAIPQESLSTRLALFRRWTCFIRRGVVEVQTPTFAVPGSIGQKENQ